MSAPRNAVPSCGCGFVGSVACAPVLVRLKLQVAYWPGTLWFAAGSRATPRVCGPAPSSERTPSVYSSTPFASFATSTT